MYVNVYATAQETRFAKSIKVSNGTELEIAKTVINKACIVVDAWGYGEYDDMYDLRVGILEHTIPGDISELGFAGGIDECNISITDTPKYKRLCTMNAWDEYVLVGCNYDPTTDPYDLNQIVPMLGADKHEYQAHYF